MSESRRIRPPKTSSKSLEKLVSDGPFISKQKALMFAATIGYQRGKRLPLSSSEEPIRWEIFERNGDDTFIFALGMAETGDIKILSDREESRESLFTIFEEYAHAGLKHLEDTILIAPGSQLDSFLGILAISKREQKDLPAGLEGLNQDDLTALGLTD